MSQEEKGKGGAIGAVIGTVVLAAACLVAGWVGGGIFDARMRAKKAAMMAARMAAMQKANAAQVAVTNAEMRAYNLPITFVAHVEPMKEVPLVPEIEGYVKEVLFAEGDLVKEGQELYRLDAERYQAVVNQRKADLAAAEAEARRAERYYKRTMSADDRGITQLERDNAEAAKEKTAAAVMQAKANLIVADYYLKRTTIKAPITGKIGKTSVYAGDYVSSSKGALAKIVQVDPIRVRFPMTDRAFMMFRQAVREGRAPNNRLRLRLPNDVEYNRLGEIDFDDNEMSDATATISMRAKFPNPDGVLVPNCYVTLLQDFTKAPSFLSVPQQCLVELTGGSQGVWVVRDDMTVETRPVKVREQFAGWVPVIEGLKEGERVVLSGTGKLMTGMKVTLATPTSNDDINPAHVSPIKE